MTTPVPPNTEHHDYAPVEVSAHGSRRKSRSVIARITVAALSLVMMLCLLLGGILALLSRGPIELPFMSERVASALENQIGNGVDIDVGRSLLERTSNGIALHIQDVVIKDRNRNTILRSPDALVAFDPLNLLKFQFLPKRFELKGIVARLHISKDGSLSFSATGNSSGSESQQSEQNNQTRATEALAAIAMLAKEGIDGELASVHIKDAVLLVDDQRTSRQLKFDQFSLSLENPQKGIALANGNLSKDGNLIPFQFEVKAVSDNLAFTLKTSNVNEALIASALGLAELPMAPSGKLGGYVSVITSQTGKIISAETRLDLREGAVTIKGVGNKPFKIQEAILDAQWGGNLSLIEKASLSIKGDEYSASMVGTISLPTSSDPWIRYRGTGKDWKVSGLSNKDAEIKIKEATLSLAVKEDGKQIILENMTLIGPETDLSINGSLNPSNEGKSLTAAARLGTMPVRNAIRWWPTFLAPATRQFFADAVKSGTLNRLDLALTFPDWAIAGQYNGRILPADALKLDALVEGVSAQISSGLPPIVGLSGAGRMNLRQADGSASAAFVELRSKKRIPLSEGAFSITGIEGFHPKGVFKFRAQTPLENVAELLKAPDLKDGFSFGFDPDSIKGQFDGRGSVTIPLGVVLKPQDILTEFTGNMTSVFVEKAIGNDRLENASLSVSSDATGLDVKGKGLWQNTPVSIELENDSKDKSSSAVLSFLMDDAGLKRIGLNLGLTLTKPLPVRIKTLREAGAGLDANIEVDLTNAAFDGLLPGYRKAAGRPGKLSFQATEKTGGYSLKNISLESGASSFKGTAEVTNGSISSAKFNLYRLSPGDNVRLDYDRTLSGQKAVIRGNNFDARPFLKADTASVSARNIARPPQSGANELDIDLKTTLLSGFGGEVITGAEIRAIRRGDVLRQFNLNGRLNGKRLQITTKPGDADAKPVQISSEDSGAFFRFIDIYSRMIGGQLEGQLSGVSGNISGTLQASRFVLRNEPAIRRLVQGATPQNASSEQAKVSNTIETRFEKMRVDFQIAGPNITVRDAVIYGSEIGLTFNGLIDNSRDRLSLSGTFIPAYGLNNALSQIPVFGRILTGARNEGVLAVTFGLSGRASQPTVTINPLSAITPGIFRKIFEFRNETSGSNTNLHSTDRVSPQN